ncbi:MAG: hypothetical protein LBM04_12575 [Opitutaceae bacterium]|jgi:hypothetical protein|nr:hypothetical protein [Opitutaceae bacterium]
MRSSIIVLALVTVCMSLLLAGCTSPLKSYQRGNYMQACEEAVKKLRGSPGNEDARTALTNAYPLAKSTADQQIASLKSVTGLYNYESIMALCDRMNRLADDIRHCPAALTLIPYPADYTAERVAAAQTAAQLAYNAGVEAANQGTLEKAREALDFFIRADRYVPGYRDARDRIGQMRHEATLRVIVMRPALSQRYQLDGDFFYNRLMADITKRTYKYLVRFYTPEEAAVEGMGNPHQILELDFVGFTVGNTREISNTVELTRHNVEIGTTTNAGGAKQSVKGTVKASYTTNRVEIISQGVLGMRTLDATTGRVLNQKNYSNTYTWATGWATFNGDERALNGDQLALTKTRRQTPPDAQTLFSSFANPLYKNCTDYISATYSP